MFFSMTEETDSDMSDEKRILAQFKSENGDVTGNAFDLPLNITAEKLQLICNAMLTNVGVYHSYIHVHHHFYSVGFDLSFE